MIIHKGKGAAWTMPPNSCYANKTALSDKNFVDFYPVFHPNDRALMIGLITVLLDRNAVVPCFNLDFHRRGLGQGGSINRDFGAFWVGLNFNAGHPLNGAVSTKQFSHATHNFDVVRAAGRHQTRRVANGLSRSQLDLRIRVKEAGFADNNTLHRWIEHELHRRDFPCIFAIDENARSRGRPCDRDGPLERCEPHIHRCAIADSHLDTTYFRRETWFADRDLVRA